MVGPGCLNASLSGRIVGQRAQRCNPDVIMPQAGSAAARVHRHAPGLRRMLRPALSHGTRAVADHRATLGVVAGTTGGTGVTLFYVISAFTLGTSMENRSGDSGALSNYFIRRIFPSFRCSTSGSCSRRSGTQLSVASTCGTRPMALFGGVAIFAASESAEGAALRGVFTSAMPVRLTTMMRTPAHTVHRSDHSDPGSPLSGCPATGAPRSVDSKRDTSPDGEVSRHGAVGIDPENVVPGDGWCASVRVSVYPQLLNRLWVTPFRGLLGFQSRCGLYAC